MVSTMDLIYMYKISIQMNITRFYMSPHSLFCHIYMSQPFTIQSLAVTTSENIVGKKNPDESQIFNIKRFAWTVKCLYQK